MEQKDFLEALENRKNLSKQSKANWAALASEYPYADVIQLLSHQRMDHPNEADLKKLLLHFDNPLHLAVVKAKHKRSVETSVQAEEVKPKEHGVEPKQEAQEPKPTKEKVSIEEKDDVLELINELPDQNPIELHDKVMEHKDKSQPEIHETKPQEDPGDLMVMMSFTDWLNHFKAKSEHEAEEKKGRDAIRSAWQKEKLAEAMDDEEDVVPDEIFEKAMKSVSFGDGLVTEPLAELYVKQGKTEKAIELYKKLSLLNPKKRTYFASRIKDLHLLK